jgi:hypothetical protein
VTALGGGVNAAGRDYDSAPTATQVTGLVDTMSRRPQLIRLVGSCLCLLVSGVFCQQFSDSQYRGLVFVAGIPSQELPALCMWLTRYSPIFLVLPPVVLFVGVIRLLRRREESAVVELLSQGVLVLSLILVVMCILAWQAPYLPPSGDPL